MTRTLLAGILALGIFSLLSAADEATPALTVVDLDGKSTPLGPVKFTSGARKLAWLAGGKGTEAPLALELREADSTNYAKGVVTWVPLASIERTEYDGAKQTVTVHVAGRKEPLSGSTQFKGINQIGFESGGAKYFAGAPKSAIKELRFANAKPFAHPVEKGPRWQITIDQGKANHPKLLVQNLRVLAALPRGEETLLPFIPARGTQKLSLDDVPPGGPNLQRMTFDVLAVDPVRGATLGYVVSNPAEYREGTLFVPFNYEPKKQQTATLLGLVGEVPTGWKFFPWHTVLKLEPVSD